MGVAKKTRKFGQVKRLIGQRDARLKTNKAKEEAANKEKAKKTAAGELIREAPQMPSNMFFQHNTALVPPYNVLVDTNFLSHTVQRKLSLLESMMDCLYAKCNPIITSCVMAELESLGPKYRLALRVARDERWQRLECDHKGTYADDCLVDRVSKNRIYIVGTNDRALKQRLRKIPGVPLMSVARGKVSNPTGSGMDQPLGDQQAQSQPQKRTRVLLSCAPCRNSKLKCDRGQPCGQCARKSAPETCVYAPKPTKKKRQPKGMAARLKRLEGMVRDMMDNEEGGDAPQRQTNDNSTSETPSFKAQVVQSNQGATYVGATHCMAILEDIEDMKSYFDDEDDAFEGDSPSDELDANDLLIQSGGAANREELLALLPEKHVADRLIMRYFGSFSPAQLVIHRPTFTAKYAQFWQDPDSASLNWLAQLFMILALGIVFSNFASPHELQTDSDVPVMERVQLYRSCAGKALVWGKYTNPTVETIPAFILYVEAYFMFSRAAQMSCYVLSGVCVRLLLKMGMHRDSSKLANISPFECEMRRRCWAMAAQVELLVSFHMGLPSMLHGIESDTGLPGNYQDEDFSEDSTEFPPERPLTDHTSMSYPLNKTKLLRVFSQIAKQAHALTPPSHAEVMRLDALVNEKWNAVPSFLHVKPLEKCIGDSPALMIQRFGLESLHHKSRCVLHRRYLAEPILKEEHDYSRQQCLQAAVTLLNYQATIWNATRPGNILSSCGWFVTSLAVHDYMLAAMILYLVIQNGHYPENGDSSHWTAPDQQPVSKDELKGLLKRSHAIWCKVSSTVGELRKTRDTLAVMLAKIGDPVDGAPVSHNSNASITSPEYTYHNPPSASSSGLSSLPATIGRSSGSESGHHSTPGIEASYIGAGVTQFGVGQVSNDDTLVTFPPVDIGITSHGMFGAIEFDSSWMEAGDSMDWRSGNAFPTDGSRGGVYPGLDQAWEQNMDLGRGW